MGRESLEESFGSLVSAESQRLPACLLWLACCLLLALPPPPIYPIRLVIGARTAWPMKPCRKIVHRVWSP